MNDLTHFIRGLFPPPCHDRIFLAGGTVRDLLLGRAIQDIDLVSALPEKMLLSAGFRLIEPSSAEPVYFRHHAEAGKIEIVRIERLEELEQDLLRRDFTINAMAMDLDGNVIDPLGGTSDLGASLLRACTPHSFSEDPLRIFRGFRFECDGWIMDRKTEALIRKAEWTAGFAAMPQERFTGELLKALSAKKPERFFERMVEMNLGMRFCPPLFRMRSIPAGPVEHHPEGDLLTHSVQVLQRVALVTEERLARFCAFFHDIGKLATDASLYPRHHGHEDAGAALAESLCDSLRLPSVWRKALSWVSRLHGRANRWEELRDSTKVKTARDALKAGIAAILPLVSAADQGEAGEKEGWEQAVRAAGMSCAGLGIDPEVLATLPVGQRSAVILQRKVEMFRRMQYRHAGTPASD